MSRRIQNFSLCVGIYLAIADEIMRQYDGSLHIKSNIKGDKVGTTIIFTLLVLPESTKQ